MNRAEIVEALREADAAIAQTQLIGFRDDGTFGLVGTFGQVEQQRAQRIAQVPTGPARWTGRPRRNSKQGRRERGQEE